MFYFAILNKMIVVRVKNILRNVKLRGCVSLVYWNLVEIYPGRGMGLHAKGQQKRFPSVELLQSTRS